MDLSLLPANTTMIVGLVIINLHWYLFLYQAIQQ